MLVDSDQAAFERHPPTPPSTSVSPAHLAYVIFTSGSTGTPKGALLPHRGLNNTIQAARETLSLRSGSRVLQLASIGFDARLFEFLAQRIAHAIGNAARARRPAPCLMSYRR